MTAWEEFCFSLGGVGTYVEADLMDGWDGWGGWLVFMDQKRGLFIHVLSNSEGHCRLIPRFCDRPTNKPSQVKQA